ncbi:carbamoyl-phosphate synthase large subunit [Meiothermus granaticius]|uniref:Carbamoyl phosphate synthase large chain n=1 Tax=Meiothermus granaticius NBRC 107808 TaxID=1227551 RepID=A0A399F9U0_9DEIN|nr:carbamoyl-phosphate synthase large subunit [Meiothermus granaticius]RIH91682.1 Carbamoyl-phosphate synthase large chain [Meiothermus granaticius NBRC 107808]GEM86102.1 carbamoyl-phosphate synthase large chain [Meiothermus granaticius NBRC 107808]
MPKRTDLKKILIIGSGPITIGQAAEFDYSGTQAVKALRGVGYEVVLVNSNPATIMTDPELAEGTYLEPLTVEFLEKIIAQERPDALLPTLGGQTALNLSMALFEQGILDKYGVELIGANAAAIHKGEDREAFQQAMLKIGVEVPRGKMVHSLEEGLEFTRRVIGYPAVIRPSFTLGGTGGGIARDEAEFIETLTRGLSLSPTHSALVEESIVGWKEYELEVMRDKNDTVVIITSIENVDPMGVHTGDSITVAPAQTLSDVEYQKMRDAAQAIIREIGVETGGSNIQFAIDPKTGRMIVIEMNPRVSRSSALASKATGFPIAKIAALLAVGYTLDEIPNDITQKTPASFEPTIDYVVVKIPRFAFEKFNTLPNTNPGGFNDQLGTQMKSVGEVMAIGRSFKEALGKALRSLEADVRAEFSTHTTEELQARLYPSPTRIYAVLELLRRKASVEELYEATRIERWFLNQMREVIEAEQQLELGKWNLEDAEDWRYAKGLGLSDAQIGTLVGAAEGAVRQQRLLAGSKPVYKTVDTCAAEFEAYTPYHYSAYELEDEVSQTDKPKVVILGSGPIRIGQGVEFDYATVHAVWALREAVIPPERPGEAGAQGYETIMVNSNPETVSTDYDTADRLYFEPLTLEDVLNLTDHEKPLGAIATLGGQTPLKLAKRLAEAGVTLLGTPWEAIHRAEDRAEFNRLCAELGIPQPKGAVARTPEEALQLAENLGYPLMARPSYVLGGRAMQVVHNAEELRGYLNGIYAALAERPSILLDQYLENALELDVDALCDGQQVVVAGIMEHIERAGVHSGDSATILPPLSLSPEQLATVKDYTRRLALAVGVKGLINVQYALKDGMVYILEANPRASRTVPFVSKAIGRPLAKYAALIAVGKTLDELGFTQDPTPAFYSVKEVLIPWLKFPGVIPVLGPEMRSTGESMGIDADPYLAYYRAELGVGQRLPLAGKVRFIGSDSLKADWEAAGFEASEGDYDLLITLTPHPELRRAVETGKPFITTAEGARWSLEAIRRAQGTDLGVRSLQRWHQSSS